MIAKKKIPRPGSVPARMLVALQTLKEPATYKEIVDIANRDTTQKHINDGAASQGVLALYQRKLVNRKLDKKRGYMYTSGEKATIVPVTNKAPFNRDEKVFLKISRKFFRAQTTGDLLKQGLTPEELTALFTYLMTAD